MAGHEVSSITPVEALDILGWKPTDLVAMTGLGINAVRRAVLGGKKRINVKTAELIADALGLSTAELDWPTELTHVGRPPLTGGSYTVGAGSFVSESGDCEFVYPEERPRRYHSEEERVPRRRVREQTEYCDNPEHQLLLPLSGICDACAA